MFSGGGILQRFQGSQNQGAMPALQQGAILTRKVVFIVTTKADDRGVKTPIQALVRVYGPLGMRPVAEGLAWQVKAQTGSGAPEQAGPTAFQIIRGRHPYEVIVDNQVVAKAVLTVMAQDVEVPVEVQGSAPPAK